MRTIKPSFSELGLRGAEVRRSRSPIEQDFSAYSCKAAHTQDAEAEGKTELRITSQNVEKCRFKIRNPLLYPAELRALDGDWFQ
jgi:hypothetical protein